ncbi:methionine adenosyltransferase [uncultured Allobaculum sp.]|uniref:methionine adenosyltransferase n=1 Tax=uncultured Allobaculum sp. TaxID=1187017 RepID=UPI002583B2B3|nr:methionine adenosyltransferase [uncultured Allobaculum sp.]
MKDYIFTSESVTEGHPDKVCDLIADSIVDEALRQDPNSNMAVEATIKDDFILVYGEANTKAVIDFEQIAKDVLKKIGYPEEYHVHTVVNKQSPEIHNAVNKNKDGKLEVAAGDQGIMFGYASNETDEFMPAPIYYAHKLSRQLTKVRRQHPDLLRPDGKTQVSVEYKDDKPVRIDTIVVSTQHSPEISQEDLSKLIRKEVIDAVIPSELLDENTKYFINPSGSFVVGGSFGDSGTTGRKIVCDTYGGMGHIGGGCFSSKDPTKVDRSAAYYARWVAKNIVANGLADKCEVEVAYAIGRKEPVSILVDTFGTGKVSDEEIMDIVKKNFNFEVGNILEELDLRKPIYTRTTNYGHFGDPKLPWEKVIELKR